MRTRALMPLLVALTIALVPAAAENADVVVREFSGEASDPKSGELLYTEHHHKTVRADGLVDIETEYRDPSGAIIATRSVHVPGDGYLPSFTFSDRRSGHVDGIRRTEGGTVMFRRRPSRDEFEEKPIPDDVTMVADAGFDRLVRDNWDRLLAGERVEAVLAVPSRLRTFRFTVVRVEDEPIDDTPVVTVRMAFSSPVLRLLAPKLLISYYRDDRVIAAFRGRSRLEDPEGGNYDVVVRYRHEDDR